MVPTTNTVKCLQIPQCQGEEKPFKISASGGLYLLVKPSGKCWRMDYRYAGKRKTLAVGIYPAISLAIVVSHRIKPIELIVFHVLPLLK